jgi:hypothetical protein
MNELSESGDFDMSLNLEAFILQVLHNRLTLISKHLKLVQMIIQESLQGRLTEELNFIGKMALKLNNLFAEYFQKNHQENIEMLSSHILGILLQYAIQTEQSNYHQLSEESQKEYLNAHLQVLKLSN